MTLEDARLNIGRNVLYERPGMDEPERGVIKGVRASGYVFVLYLGDREAKATRPEDLSLEVVR